MNCNYACRKHLSNRAHFLSCHWNRRNLQTSCMMQMNVLKAIVVDSFRWVRLNFIGCKTRSPRFKFNKIKTFIDHRFHYLFVFESFWLFFMYLAGVFSRVIEENWKNLANRMPWSRKLFFFCRFFALEIDSFLWLWKKSSF